MFTRDDVQKLAALARISITEEEAVALTGDIKRILVYVSAIQKIEGKTDEAPLLRNVMRKDGEPHARGAYTEKLLQAAPRRRGDHIAVKRIITRE